MMNGQNRQNILVDTSIPLEGGEAVIAKLNKVAPVFVTDIVLQELDGHKNNSNGAVAYQAREFFRRLGKTNGEALFVLPPDGMKLEKTDTLRKMTLGNMPLHVIVRKPYKSRDINDSKIIEVAKDYNMTLVTLDMAQRVRALSEGVNVETLEKIVPRDIDTEERVIVESEVEKLMRKTEEQNKEKTDFPVGSTIGFLVVGAVCSLGADSFWGTFSLVSGVILFFAFVSSNMKPVDNKSNMPNTRSGKNNNSDTIQSPDLIHDPAYTGHSGNIYN